MNAVTGIATGIGLSTAAGLNAYLPLLIIAVLARFTDLIELTPPYDALTSWWVIGVLAVLLVIELFVDKVPALDTANDIVQTVIRPIAGAILFASNAHLLSEIHPVLAIACGLLIAGGVHAAKATFRPVVTGTTGGMFNPVVSLLEDIVSLTTTILAVFVPILLLFLIVVLIGIFIWLYRKRRQKRGILLKEKLAANDIVPSSSVRKDNPR